MPDLHFATNHICIAARLANLALKRILQQNDVCIVPRLAKIVLRSADGLMKRKHTIKKEGVVGDLRKKGSAIGTMPPWILAFTLVTMGPVNGALYPNAPLH